MILPTCNMNLLRHPLRYAISRAYTTRPFVPPSQLRDLDNNFRAFQASGGSQGPTRGRGSGSSGKGRRRGRKDEEDGENQEWEPESTKVKPDSPSFYTGRPVYYDQVIQLENAISSARGALKTLQLLPLPTFARESLPPLRPVWKGQDEMTTDFQSKMTTSRYRRVTTLLNELNDYLRIATTAGCTDLAAAIGQIVVLFESGKKDAFLARGKRKKVFLDNYGRSYTFGKRKTSAARVWMIRVQPRTTSAQTEEPVDQLSESAPSTSVTTTTILVNKIPLAEYFPVPADRERIIRPLKIAGVLGAYNVFSIVRGGGTTGQSGALSHGIAKALVAHEPELENVLRKAKLMRRDPRMVERKKTGLAKARKRYTWVKR
ncbi:SSU ribosomal protein S9P [Collybia nuda]|uniref:SSU ribosomal protein S9P n=1 Tax=Collybia nuda TaxID=64659 RepID=A0A9P6CRC9_9AGAR|nr:SSU ribosomal protein S9P [Collybia nuda]